MMENGQIINLMEKEFLLGLMEEGMKENIKMIKRMDMEFLNGLMEKNTKENGKMANKMEKVNSIMIKIIHGENALFKMEKESNGLKSSLKNKIFIFKTIYFL